MRTFFTILTRWHNEIRPFTVEGSVPETVAEVQHQIDQFSKGQTLFKVFRVEDEDTIRDVTAEFLPEEEKPEPYIPVYCINDDAADRMAAE